MGKGNMTLVLVANAVIGAALCLVATPASAQNGWFKVQVPDDCEVCPNDETDKLLDTMTAVMDTARTDSFGELAQSIMLRYNWEHDQLIASRGCGKYVGNTFKGRTPAVNPPPIKTDCSEIVLDILEEAFEIRGESARWDRILARAQVISAELGPGGFKGAGLTRALQEEMGWTGLLWAPDAGRADRRDNVVSRTRDGKKYYGMKLDPNRLVVDYGRAGAPTQLSRLENLPFGILDAHGGEHLAVIMNGIVYEVHRSDGCDNPRLIEATHLGDWQTEHWHYGAIAAPASDVERAWNEIAPPPGADPVVVDTESAPWFRVNRPEQQ